MPANAAIQETQLIESAVAWLDHALPTGWAAKQSQTLFSNGANPEPLLVDSMIEIEGPSGVVSLLVEAKEVFSPRDAQQLLQGVARAFRGMSNTQLLVVSNWFSARTQELLRQQDVNYIDLTGNAYLTTNYPAIFIHSTGASRNPSPAERERSGIRGPKAGRLIRTLLDVRPPYGVRELAQVAGLTPGYVSRLLSTLEYEALIDRSGGGAVASVEVGPLLRRWVEVYDVTRSNTLTRLLAPQGPREALKQISEFDGRAGIAVTGSFAAVRSVPVAAPTMLMLYARDAAFVRTQLNLLPVTDGANVVLLAPYDEVAFERTTRADDVTYACVSQVAADCLTGPGRMPEEGNALVDWMSADDRWRVPSLADLQTPR